MQNIILCRRDDVNPEQTISMVQIFSILRKYIKVILGTALVVGALATAVTFLSMTPKYSSTTEILVNRKLPSQMQGAQFQQSQADVQMINTYKDIITSPTVLRDVNREIKHYPAYHGSMKSLKKSISINSSQNSQVFSVSAKAGDPKTAAATANLTAKVFKKKIGKIISINNVSIVSKATAEPDPISPRKKLNILAGVILGLMLGVAIAFILELTDRTIRDERFITDELKLTSLGIINKIDQKVIDKMAMRKKELVKNNRLSSGKVRRV